jgi:hypothetical protein
MVKKIYRLVIATIVQTPKSVSQAATNRHPVWQTQSKTSSTSTRQPFMANKPQYPPIKTFLKHRKVISEDKSAACGHESKNLEHRFLKCLINKETWVVLYGILPFLCNINLIELVDLDFGLPPSLQRGAEILLLEGLYTLWTARNEVTFERRQHDGCSVRDFFMRRARIRIKTEWSPYAGKISIRRTVGEELVVTRLQR